MKSLRAVPQDILTEMKVAYNENTVILNIMITDILFRSTESRALGKHLWEGFLEKAMF